MAALKEIYFRVYSFLLIHVIYEDVPHATPHSYNNTNPKHQIHAELQLSLEDISAQY